MSPLEFASLMERELEANSSKGDFSTWCPDRKAMLGELGYHVAKLCYALGAEDKQKVKEYAADVANICMKIVEVRG